MMEEWRIMKSYGLGDKNRFGLRVTGYEWRAQGQKKKDKGQRFEVGGETTIKGRLQGWKPMPEGDKIVKKGR